MDKKGRRDGEDGKNTFKSSRGELAGPVRRSIKEKYTF